MRCLFFSYLFLEQKDLELKLADFFPDLCEIASRKTSEAPGKLTSQASDLKS
jgi:hypothetical protein